MQPGEVAEPASCLPIVTGPLRFLHRMEHGINDPWLVRDLEGRRWIRKDMTSLALSRQGFLGECLAWLIGRRVEVPIPDAAIWRGGMGEFAWLSAYIPHTLPWSERMASRVADWRGLGATLAMDVALLNRDRNAANLLLEVLSNHSLWTWAIDHDRLGIADQDYLREHLDHSLQDLPHFDPSHSQPRGSVVEALRSPSLATAMHLSALPEPWLAEILREGLEKSGYPVQDRAPWAALLHARLQRAPALVERYLSYRGI